MASGLRGWAPFSSTLLLLAGCGQVGVPQPNPFPTSSATSATASSGAGGDGGAGGQGGASATTSGPGGAGGATTASATTASATTGSGGAGPCGGSSPPVLINKGDADKLLLKGMVVTPDQAFAGEVLVVGDTIACAAPSCSAAPGAATASVIDTQGILFPGLIDTHNHILFDVFDEDDWAPTQTYTNHNQWTSNARYGAMVDAKQFLNGEIDVPGLTADLGCELDKYGELKGLIAGTTSILGSATPGNKACYGSLSRTIDEGPNGLTMDGIQTATLFPSTASADGVCANFTSGKTSAYVIHIAEGIDAVAQKEFATLKTISTVDDCLLVPKTTIVHGTALGDAELGEMASAGMSLVWSPKSNVFLYGAGTTLTATANIPLAMSKGINIALAPDWSIGGSQNLLDELRFADHVDNVAWNDVLTPQTLVKMVTSNAAKALGLDSALGSITAGKKADLVIIGGDTCNPYDALLAATPGDVRLVLVGGVPLYGDKALQPIAQTSPACEDLDICSKPKFACVAAPGGTAVNKLGQTFGEIKEVLESTLTQYDAQGLSQWKFAPLAPLLKCP